MFTTAEEIIALLTELGQRLHAAGQEAEIYVVGGAAMLLGYDRRVVTRDIDALLLPVAEVEEVARRMAEDRGDLPPDWLSAAVVPLLPRVADVRRWEALNMPGLCVLVASPEHLLAMKARAGRGPRDLEDVAVLCEILGLRSTGQVWEICRTVWGEDLIRDDVRAVIEEFLQSRGMGAD